ncbi:VOC family protein, partial [Caballeronia terrestris]|uniref:VOC family protein n=1 Tax=Caballeronia terrestris TaxID=1226301 RepID=UPI002E0FB141
MGRISHDHEFEPGKHATIVKPNTALCEGRANHLCAFYTRHFGFECKLQSDDRIAELISPHGGAILMVHKAAKSVKTGQVTVKLVFDIEDIEAFKAQCAQQGLEFGSSHRAD